MDVFLEGNVADNAVGSLLARNALDALGSAGDESDLSATPGSFPDQCQAKSRSSPRYAAPKPGKQRHFQWLGRFTCLACTLCVPSVDSACIRQRSRCVASLRIFRLHHLQALLPTS